MNTEDQEMADLEEWLAILRESKDDEFRIGARPYFDDTAEMDAYIEEYKGRHRA